MTFELSLANCRARERVRIDHVSDVSVYRQNLIERGQIATLRLGYPRTIEYSVHNFKQLGRTKPVCTKVSCVWNIAYSMGDLLAVLTGRGQREHTVGRSSYTVLSIS